MKTRYILKTIVAAMLTMVISPTSLAESAPAPTLATTSITDLASIFSSVLQGNASAQAAQAVQSSDIKNSIDNLVAGYGIKSINQLNVATPFIAQTKALSTSQASGPVNSVVKGVSTDSTLVSSQESALAALNANGDYVAGIVKSLGTNAGITSCGGDKCPKIDANGAKSYILDGLLSPLTYKDDQKQAAGEYIKYAASLINPIRVNVPDPVNSTDLSPQRYVAVIRSYVAAQQAGLSNLYQMYNNRLPVEGLGKDKNLPDSIGNNVSPLQIDDYSATRRFRSDNAINGNDWMTNMETASPATIARETLYLLAEMRLEMYKSRLEMERSRAVLSLMQLQQNRQAATNDLTRIQVEQMQISAQQPSTDTGATPPASS